MCLNKTVRAKAVTVALQNGLFLHPQRPNERRRRAQHERVRSIGWLADMLLYIRPVPYNFQSVLSTVIKPALTPIFSYQPIEKRAIGDEMSIRNIIYQSMGCAIRHPTIFGVFENEQE